MTLKNRFPKYMAEAIATFCLVFAGTSAMAVNELTQGHVTHLGISLVFGLVVMAMIYAVGHISGAHMNPAVTLAFAFLGRMTWRESVFYVLAQMSGGLLASFMVNVIFPSTSLGVTMPSGPVSQSLSLEFVFTAILMFVIVGVAHDERAEGIMAGVAIGAVIMLEALIGGPISGASMNPARSLAPALVSGQWVHQWIYVLGPVFGAIFGAILYRCVRCQIPDGERVGSCC